MQRYQLPKSVRKFHLFSESEDSCLDDYEITKKNDPSYNGSDIVLGCNEDWPYACYSQNASSELQIKNSPAKPYEHE